jgi:hypothetical protein
LGGDFVLPSQAQGTLRANELCNESYFFFQTSTAKELSCTVYETISKNNYNFRNIVATPGNF